MIHIRADAWIRIRNTDYRYAFRYYKDALGYNRDALSYYKDALGNKRDALRYYKDALRFEIPVK